MEKSIKLSARASEYVAENVTTTDFGGRLVILPEGYDVPRAVSKSLTNAFGPPTTLNGGEATYWILPDEFRPEVE